MLGLREHRMGARLGQEQIQRGDPPPLPGGGVLRAAATKGVRKLSHTGSFTNTPDNSTASHRMAPGHPSGAAHLEGKPSSLRDLRFPGTHSLPHRLGWGVLAGVPQPVGSPKVTKCPTEESAMAPTCSQTPENRLDESCIPNGGGRGGGGGSLKAGRDFQVPLN